MRLIDVEKKLTITVFDEEQEEYIEKVVSVEEILDAYTDEGCPTIYSNPEPVETTARREEVHRKKYMSQDGIIAHLAEVGERIKGDAKLIGVDSKGTKNIKIEALIEPQESVTTVTYEIERLADPRIKKRNDKLQRTTELVRRGNDRRGIEEI